MLNVQRKSAPLPERLCERIAYCAILLTVYEADYSVVVAQSEGADHRYYSTPEMQNILLQNAVGHAVRKAKNSAGGVTDTIFSGRPVLINLMSDFVLDKTKATAKGRQWVLRQIKLERITNNATFAAGGQSVTGKKSRWGCQPFCSVSRLSNSRRKSLLIHPERLASPSSFMAILKRSNKLASRRSCTENLSFWLSLVDIVNLGGDNVIEVTMYTNGIIKATPHSAVTHAGRLTTNDSKDIEAAMRNHTQTKPEFIYTFTALHRDRMADGATTVHVAAYSLADARRMVKKMGYVAAFWKGRKENRLITTTSQGYYPCAPHKTGAGIGTPLEKKAIQTPNASFFVSAHTHTLSMVGCTGPTSVGLVSFFASSSNSVQSTASELGTSGGGYIPTKKEAAIMATIPAFVHSQTAFIWRFITVGASEPQIIHVTACTEREARNRCPSGCVAVFAARIRQEVAHA
ncbi:host cell division inhibitor Icd-like protein [Salmonella enterica]|uniref:host cell division inhibitor Icd-like protein n=1 Tax=Salmonella enterica TaxID=28901 RepID=UPI0021179499